MSLLTDSRLIPAGDGLTMPLAYGTSGLRMCSSTLSDYVGVYRVGWDVSVDSD